MKSLYNTDHRYTEDAINLDNLTYAAIRNIFDEFVKEGYSPREISYLMQNSIRDKETETVL